MAKANPAVIIELLGDRGEPIQYTVADGTGIEKGTLLTMTDPRTASETSNPVAVLGVVPAGIAAEEKVASDGSTKISAYTHGIFDIRASGAITVGGFIKFAGANEVMACTATEMISGTVVGRALETATDQEVIACLIHI